MNLHEKNLAFNLGGHTHRTVSWNNVAAFWRLANGADVGAVLDRAREAIGGLLTVARTALRPRFGQAGRIGLD